jgi:hypothetical protein
LRPGKEDEQTGQSFKTIELVLEETAWKPRKTPYTQDRPSRGGLSREGRIAEGLVGLRVEGYETRWRSVVKAAGGWWSGEERLWELQRDRVAALGLEDRIVVKAQGR